MTVRPKIAPAVVTALTDQAPSRVRRKLDRQSDVAEGWNWQQEGDVWTVQAGNEIVRLAADGGVVREVDNVTCSCLLSPRCFHALACVHLLELDDGVGPSKDESAKADSSEADSSEVDVDAKDVVTEVALDEAQRDAARLTWNACATVLATGARAAGALPQAEMLRAVHECRARGLHRLAASGLRIVESVRQARADKPDFRLESLNRDLGESLACAHRLRDAETAARDDVGVARRAYESIPGLRLSGLFSESIATRSGYAGVVTYLLTSDQRVLTVSDVMPGGPERILGAWRGGVQLGDLAISHKDLSRAGLFVQKGTASFDGRLGAGKDCQAVTAKAGDWSTAPFAELFERPLEDQINAVFARSPFLPGDELLYVRGEVLGVAGPALAFLANDPRLPLRLLLRPPSSPVARENLRLLGRAPGLRLRCIVRLLRSQAGQAELLALGPDESAESNQAPRLVLPESWKGHLSCALETLERKHLTAAERHPVELGVVAPATPDGLGPLERALGRVALGGRHSLPQGSAGRREREAQRLESQHLPTAATLLRGLSDEALKVEKAFDGVRFPADPTPLVKRWLAGMAYTEAARRTFERRSWLET